MDKKYFAFISYQRKDEKHAEWLRRSLEKYHLPANLRKENVALPKDIRPIFRDSLELSGGFLAKEIERALNDSRFLLVVCSPNSAKSPWVNKEIQTFIDQGREDCIIPFIIDGVPYSNDDNECFPPALRSLCGEKEILGININELGRDAAVVKVVARMFGLKFDTLWQRHNREQRRKRIAWGLFAVMLVIASLFISGYFYKMNSEIEGKNREIVEQNREIAQKNEEITRQNKEITQKNVEVTEKSKEIERQYNEIAEKNEEITQRNEEISRGRDKLLVSQSKYLVSEAKKEYDKGNITKALRMALYALPKNLKNPDRPYVTEAEAMLRKCDISLDDYTEKNTCKIKLLHSSSVNSATFSPDGKYIVTASRDKTACIWDAVTGRIANSPLIHEFPVTSAVFSPCGKYVVTVSEDYLVRVWNISNAKQIVTPLKHDKSVVDAFFSYDGKKIITVTHDKVNVWDIATGKYLSGIKDNAGFFNAATFSPCGKYIVTTSNEKVICVWDAVTGTVVKELSKEKYSVNSVAFSPDEKYFLTTSNDSVVCIWDVAKGTLVGKPLKHNEKYIKSAIFSSNGKYIITELYQQRRVWNVANMSDVTDSVAKNALNIPEYKIPLLKKSGNSVDVLDNRASESVLCLKHDANVESAYFSPDGKYVITISHESSIDESNAYIWDAKTGCVVLGPLKHKRRIKHIAFFPKTDVVFISSSEGKTYSWNIKTGKLINDNINASFVNFNTKGTEFVTVSNYHDVTVWDASSGKSSMTLPKSLRWVNYVAFSLDGKSLVTTSGDSTARVWDIKTGKPIGLPLKHAASVKTADFSPCGKYVVTASYDSNTRIWDIANDKVWSIEHAYSSNSAVFSPDGKFVLIASLGNPGLSVWDISNRNMLWAIDGFGNIANNACFHPNGNWILASFNFSNTVYLIPFTHSQELIDKYRNDPEHDWSLSQDEKDEYSLE